MSYLQWLWVCRTMKVITENRLRKRGFIKRVISWEIELSPQKFLVVSKNDGAYKDGKQCWYLAVRNYNPGGIDDLAVMKSYTLYMKTITKILNALR